MSYFLKNLTIFCLLFLHNNAKLNAQIAITIDTVIKHKYDSGSDWVKFNVRNTSGVDIYIERGYIETLLTFIREENRDTVNADTIGQANTILVEMAIHREASGGFEFPIRYDSRDIDKMYEYDSAFAAKNNSIDVVRSNNREFFVIKPETSITVYSELSHFYEDDLVGALHELKSDKTKACLQVKMLYYTANDTTVRTRWVSTPYSGSLKKVMIAHSNDWHYQREEKH